MQSCVITFNQFIQPFAFSYFLQLVPVRYQRLVCYHELYPIISPYPWWKKLQSVVCANESFVWLSWVTGCRWERSLCWGTTSSVVIRRRRIIRICISSIKRWMTRHLKEKQLQVRLGPFWQPIIKVMTRSRGGVFKP